jgi:RHS repeat-associated protein
VSTLVRVSTPPLPPIGQTYAWDANGNLQTISTGGSTVKTFTFDDANRLTNLAIAGGAAYSYTYNGAGDRLTQTVGSTTTQYLLDLNGGLSQVLSDGTNLYIPGIGQTSADGSNPQFYITDAEGSTRLMTDASGAILGAPQSYDPFGSALTSPISSIGYTGQWKDASGLEYLRARYYDPSTGRFISKDPLSGTINQPSTMNGWAYASNDPTNKSDPSGRCYGVLAFERNVPGLSTLCAHMDQAYAISGSSNANIYEKTLANSYITGMVFSQSAISFGGGVIVGKDVLGGAIIQALPTSSLYWINQAMTLAGIYGVSQLALQFGNMGWRTAIGENCSYEFSMLLLGLAAGGQNLEAPEELSPEQAAQVRELVELGTIHPDAESVMIGSYREYIDNAGEDYTYFDLGDLYNKNPTLSEEANKQFMKDQMSAGKPFVIQLPLGKVIGKGLLNELDMLMANPNYLGSLSERFFWQYKW